jgi:phosphoserine phosphatase RsbU/P
MSLAPGTRPERSARFSGRSARSVRGGNCAARSGHVLVVFGDGITEALNGDGADFGEARPMSSSTANRDASAQTVLERLLADVQNFSRGVEQSDDLTALVLRYTGS